MEVALWQLGGALVAGLGVSVIYFGGLWLTVRRVPTARRPHLLVFGSLALRLALAGAVIALLGWVHWQLLAACMVGFIVGRIVLVRRWGRERPTPPEPPAEKGSEA